MNAQDKSPNIVNICNDGDTINTDNGSDGTTSETNIESETSIENDIHDYLKYTTRCVKCNLKIEEVYIPCAISPVTNEIVNVCNHYYCIDCISTNTVINILRLHEDSLPDNENIILNNLMSMKNKRLELKRKYALLMGYNDDDINCKHASTIKEEIDVLNSGIRALLGKDETGDALCYNVPFCTECMLDPQSKLDYSYQSIDMRKVKEHIPKDIGYICSNRQCECESIQNVAYICVPQIFSDDSDYIPVCEHTYCISCTHTILPVTHSSHKLYKCRICNMIGTNIISTNNYTCIACDKQIPESRMKKMCTYAKCNEYICRSCIPGYKFEDYICPTDIHTKPDTGNICIECNMHIKTTRRSKHAQSNTETYTCTSCPRAVCMNHINGIFGSVREERIVSRASKIARQCIRVRSFICNDCLKKAPDNTLSDLSEEDVEEEGEDELSSESSEPSKSSSESEQDDEEDEEDEEDEDDDIINWSDDNFDDESSDNEVECNYKYNSHIIDECSVSKRKKILDDNNTTNKKKLFGKNGSLF